jgi:hypothetical protein
MIRETPRMTRALALLSLLALVAVPAAASAVRIVDSLDLAALSQRGAIGLSVPGAGPTVTRESALNTLLTGKVRSSLVGGTPPGTPLLELNQGGLPDTLVVLPPAGRTENRLYPMLVLGGSTGAVLTSDSTRIPGLVSLSDVATGRLRFVAVDDPVGTLETLRHRIDRNEHIRLPLSILVGGIAYLTALCRPRWGPRVFLLVLAGNLWLAGWWLVALLTVAALVLPLGLACAAVLVAYLAVLGLDPAAVALSPFGPSQAGRFYGVSNLLETFLLVPALLGAALLGRLGVLVAGIAVVAVGGNRFGADGGGLLVLLAAYGVLALRLLRVRITARRALAIGAAAVVAGAALVGLDALLGGSSHVTNALGGGPGSVLADVGNRLEVSARRTFGAVGPAFAALASLAVIAWVAMRRPHYPITDALLAGLLVSLVVNDTPGDVLGVGAAAAFTLWRLEQFRSQTAGEAG